MTSRDEMTMLDKDKDDESYLSVAAADAANQRSAWNSAILDGRLGFTCDGLSEEDGWASLSRDGVG